MKKLILFALVFSATISFGQRTCGTMEIYERMIETESRFKSNRDLIEKEAGSILSINAVTEPLTIKVVVHVLWKELGQNISEQQIRSQIDILNQDFKGINSDLNQVPIAFKPYIGKSMINFSLADKDPNNIAHNGIIRKKTTRDVFPDDDSMKFSRLGGSDAWPRDKFLNLWVCNLDKDANGNQLLGYAQFPGGPANTDGVVIWYKAFGNSGAAQAPFDKGRTGTHEVGHWLDLYHIWGNNRIPTCNDSDEIADTPNQLGPNSRKPLFPKVSCKNGPNGDMFMNYMDYVDDEAMFMFTKDQMIRMCSAVKSLRKLAYPQIDELKLDEKKSVLPLLDY